MTSVVDSTELREAAALVLAEWDQTIADGGLVTIALSEPIDALRAVLAVRPGPSASVPDEDLPGYRKPFTGPLGSRGDPTVALSGPSGDADAAALLRVRLNARRGYPTTDRGLLGVGETTKWSPDPDGAYVGFEDAWDIVLAALRAAAPSDGAGGLDVGIADAGHNVLADGKCEHRWRNRQTKVVSCRFADGWHAGRRALALAMENHPAAALQPTP